ncbi:MAG: site-2 protease family protein [Gammaproteobacteria bacterium]|nr:site-2 protease family protein [Gammaproteobacteria bacterium]MDE0512330.1 site-2 protease family protein [Gammaproteobacteria bacterium]
MFELSLAEKIVVAAIPIIFAITVHEVAHGWVAGKLGDPTARLAGRLTLNPVKHIDPLGTIVVPLVMIVLTPFAFGWAKPVPVDWRNLKQPRRDMALVAAAGPGANIVMLALWTLLLSVPFAAGNAVSYPSMLFIEMAKVGIIINIVLIALNLLPLPPLDGSRIVTAFLSPAAARRYNALERWGLPILVVLIFTGVLEKILYPMVDFMLSVVSMVLGG